MGAQLYGYLPYSDRPAGKKQQEWYPIKGIYQTDGSLVLKVDTELELDAGNIYISNLKVGSVDQTKTNTRFLKTLDDGTIVTISNPTQFYRPADIDDKGPGNVSYYGFTDINGNWYILEEDLSVTPNTYRYAKGSANYPANFIGRAGLTYGYFYNIF